MSRALISRDVRNLDRQVRVHSPPGPCGRGVTRSLPERVSARPRRQALARSVPRPHQQGSRRPRQALHDAVLGADAPRSRRHPARASRSGRAERSETKPKPLTRDQVRDCLLKLDALMQLDAPFAPDSVWIKACPASSPARPTRHSGRCSRSSSPATARSRSDSRALTQRWRETGTASTPGCASLRRRRLIVRRQRRARGNRILSTPLTDAAGVIVWQQWQRSAFVRVRASFARQGGNDLAVPVSAHLRERARTFARTRQAGGHWFEPSTAH
jgi:hypothetical protein